MERLHVARVLTKSDCQQTRLWGQVSNDNSRAASSGVVSLCTACCIAIQSFQRYGLSATHITFTFCGHFNGTTRYLALCFLGDSVSMRFQADAFGNVWQNNVNPSILKDQIDWIQLDNFEFSVYCVRCFNEVGKTGEMFVKCNPRCYL